MAKDGSGILNIALLGVAGYFVWQYFSSSAMATPAPSPAPTPKPTPSPIPIPVLTPTPNPTPVKSPPTSATQPTFANVTQTTTSPGILNVTLGQSWPAVSFAINGTPVVQTGSGANYQVAVPSGMGVGMYTLTVATAGGTTGTNFTIVAGVATPPAGPTSKQDYLNSLIAGLNNASGGGSQSLDVWNWYMVNTLNAIAVGPDPTLIAAQAGIGRSDSCTASVYIQAMDELGYISYPSGLSGFAGLTAGIQRINRHPLAGFNLQRRGGGYRLN